LNIIVCIKQIMDPQIPPSKFKIDTGAKRVMPPEGIPPVINPYDAQAVELAIKLKEKNGGKITVLTAGNEASGSIVKHAFAMGADEGAILNDATFAGSDNFSTAYIITRAIQKIGEYDLILCGRQAADWDEGTIGPIIAENLGIPLVNLAKEIEIADGMLKVQRAILDGYQTMTSPVPSVITVSNEAGAPRLPSGWGIISAAKKQIPVWDSLYLETDGSMVGSGAARKELVDLYRPDQSRKCQIITGETPDEAAGKLVQTLRSAGII
jgi:electron transfer flavoprotein beta subunit